MATRALYIPRPLHRPAGAMATFSRDVVPAVAAAILFVVLVYMELGRGPRVYAALHEWTRPPYVYVLVNGIVASIAASSRLARKGRGAAEEELAAGGRSEEEGLVVSRPYEEVVKEVKVGAVPGACGVALPFGEVVDVGSCRGDRGGLPVSSSEHEQAKTTDKPSMHQTEIPTSGTNLVRNNMEGSVEVLEGAPGAQEEAMHLGTDELNRRVECFINNFNHGMKLQCWM